MDVDNVHEQNNTDEAHRLQNAVDELRQEWENEIRYNVMPAYTRVQVYADDDRVTDHSESDIVDAIGGWKTSGVGQGYGNGYPLDVLGRWMGKINLY